MDGRNKAHPLRFRMLFAIAGAVSLTVRAEGTGLPLPSPGLTPEPAKGKVLYDENCASCHGADLKGSDQGPPFLHRVYRPAHHADLAFQLAVKNGTYAHHWQFGEMKPVPGLTPDDVAHITAYVRAEQRRAGIR